MARFGQAFFWAASAPHNPPLALPSYLPIGPTNCFYWASKLLHGTFWPGLKTFKSPAAAFESLSTAQPSACFAIVPPHKPFKLFLLGFETATWHVYICLSYKESSRKKARLYLFFESMLHASGVRSNRQKNWQSIFESWASIFWYIYIYVYIVFCLVYPPNEMDFTVPVVLLFTWRARTTSQIEEQLWWKHHI